MSRHRRLRLVTILGTTVATVATAAIAGAVAPVAAAPAAPARASWHPIASGLDNPRQLTFDRKGRLFVVEAGRGGAGPCFVGGDGGRVCYGASGAVTVIDRLGHHRVASGYPSLAGAGGASAIGPSDLVLGRHGRYTLSIGFGNPPAKRSLLPTLGQRFMGTLTKGTFRNGSRFVFSNLASFEQAKDPAKDGPDSDPTGFIKRSGGFVAVDSGGNALLNVSSRGVPSAIRTFPTRSVPSPFPGPAIDMQSVPTSVARGPHGTLFVSELSGFPFPQGAARIFKIVRGQKTQVYASGLTNVTDLAWSRGQLYAVQISDVGLFAEKALPSGSLVKIVRGKPVTVADNLPAPYGVAIRRGSAYVTTCAVCARGGGVAKVALN